MRRDRIMRIREIIRYLGERGVESHEDPRIHELTRYYLKTKYGFSDNTVKDYIETIIAILREMKSEEKGGNP